MFTSEQTRAITYNILRKQQPPHLTDAEVNTILDDIMQRSKNTAKRNIAQVSPELTPVIREIETWLTQTV
jgi:hypothetical protein